MPPPPRPYRPGPRVNVGPVIVNRPAPDRATPPSGRRNRSAAWVGLGLALVVVMVFFAVLLSVRTGGEPVSTVNRERLDANLSYQTDVVYDGLGWVDASSVSRDMKYFYDQTGVQPALALFDHIAGTTGDETAEAEMAKQWYDEHVDGEGGLLLAYFDTGTEEEGFAHLVYGDLTKSVMDAEAEDIFWNYYDRYWTDNSVDLNDAYPLMFNRTADRIMQQTTTNKDVLRNALLVLAVITAAAMAIAIMKLRRRHEAERAAETTRILETPLSGPTRTVRVTEGPDGEHEIEGTGDPLLDQYLDNQD